MTSCTISNSCRYKYMRPSCIRSSIEFTTSSTVVAAILRDPPPLLAYLSCDMATQARDLKRLLQPEGPYQLDQLQPVDFFPQTTHLENLAFLRRISS